MFSCFIVELNVFVNQKKSDIYDLYFQTMLFHVTMICQKKAKLPLDWYVFFETFLFIIFIKKLVGLWKLVRYFILHSYFVLHSYFNTFRVIKSVCVAIAVILILVARAIGLNRKYPGILFTLQVLDKSFLWRKLISTLWLVVKFPESP